MHVLSLSPQMVDEFARQEAVTLRQIQRVVPRQFLTPDPCRSWWALFRVLGSIAACLYALSLIPVGGGAALLWQIPALCILWVIYGWVLVGAFVIGHDCGHGSFSRRPWVNSLVGHLCFSPLANSFHAWRLTHNHHHLYTQLRGREVDWASFLVTAEEFRGLTWKRSFLTRFGYAVPFGPFFWIWANTFRRGLLLRSMFSSQQWDTQRNKLRWSNAIMATSLALIYGGSWYFWGLWGMMKYYAIPAWIAMVSGWLIIAIQHANECSILYESSDWTPARGQLVSTFDTRFPAWLEYIWCNITLHIPHHVCPGIPWYYLKQAGQAIHLAYPHYYQEQKFGWRHLTCFYRAPFLRKIEGKGYYVFDIARYNFGIRGESAQTPTLDGGQICAPKEHAVAGPRRLQL